MEDGEWRVDWDPDSVGTVAEKLLVLCPAVTLNRRDNESVRAMYVWLCWVDITLVITLPWSWWSDMSRNSPSLFTCFYAS